MIHLFPWKPPRLLLLISCLSNGLFICTDALSDLCSDQTCLHGSSCRIATDGQMTTATCLCPQGWVGQHCQGRLHIVATSVTMTTVTLQAYANVRNGVHLNPNDLYFTETTSEPVESKLDFQERPSKLLGSENVQFFKYSIHYWTRDRTALCNIVPQLTMAEVRIAGLQNDTVYTFCAKTHPDVWCDFELDLVKNAKDVSYCVHVRTRATPLSPEPITVPSFYVIIVVCIATISFVILLVIIAVSIRKKYFSVMICARSSSLNSKHVPGHKTRYDRGKHPSNQQSELWPLAPPTDMCNSAITVRPPKCAGKPPTSLVQNRMRGYASFSAKNEQTIALTTVIEYASPDESPVDDWEEDETTDTMETVLSGSTRASVGTFTSVPGINSNGEEEC